VQNRCHEGPAVNLIPRRKISVDQGFLGQLLRLH